MTDRDSHAGDVGDHRRGIEGSLARELGDISVEVAEGLGRFLTENRPAELEQHAKSTPTDIVTQMDSLAESLAREMIARRRPDDGFLGEEGSRSSSASGLVWIVDPIDGTTNYIYGLPMWAVSVAVVHEGKAIAGCVHSPELDMTASAVRGGGAVVRSRGGSAPLSTSACQDIGKALIGTGFGYSPDRRTSQGQLVAELVPLVRDIRRAGAASLDLCWVGAGLLDGYYEEGLHVWDFAAGALIVEEAGGTVTTLDDESVWSAEMSSDEWGTIIAAAPGVHAQLRALVGNAATRTA